MCGTLPGTFLLPHEEEYLCHHDGPKQNEEHLRVHEVVSPVFLLNHPMSQPVGLLGAELAPFNLIPIHGGGYRCLLGMGREGGREWVDVCSAHYLETLPSSPLVRDSETCFQDGRSSTAKKQQKRLKRILKTAHLSIST